MYATPLYYLGDDNDKEDAWLLFLVWCYEHAELTKPSGSADVYAV